MTPKTPGIISTEHSPWFKESDGEIVGTCNMIFKLEYLQTPNIQRLINNDIHMYDVEKEVMRICNSVKYDDI